MSDDLMAERDSRIGPDADGRTRRAEEAPPAARPPGDGLAPMTGKSWGWRETAARWAGVGVGAPRGEGAIHELAAVLERTDDESEIKQCLIQLVYRITDARRVELICESDHSARAAAAEGADGRQADRVELTNGCAGQWARNQRERMLELVLCRGPVVWGRLRMLPASGRPHPWSSTVVRRLKTLCTMTASALERGERSRELRAERGGLAESLPDPDNRAAAFDPEGETELDLPDRIAVLHDATFLNAVLPFAFSQSVRHREALALLCVSVDRLNGIRELLGEEQGDRAVRQVGEQIVTMLRSSDIVAQLDDARIVAVLPRAEVGDALRIAQSICRSVQENSTFLTGMPELTVSIGVAGYPACAGNLYALFDAADTALSRAQHQGRNRAVAAPKMNLRPEIRLAHGVG